MNKHIWDISHKDLELSPVWFFPYAEDADIEETIVLPANEREASDPNSLIIVATVFEDADNNKYGGYIHWCKPAEIAHNQPVMFFENETVSFWSGIQNTRL